MKEIQNKIVELHKHIVAANNLIRDLYSSADENLTHSVEDEYLALQLIPLAQNSIEQMLEDNGIFCLNTVVKNEINSDYYEKAEYDPNAKKEDTKTKG